LKAPVKGVSGFAEEFAKKGPTDKKGRSLREFDLTRRMFRYPMSYLVYSEAFDALPPAAKERFYARLVEVLDGKDKTPMFASMTAEDRASVRAILLETKPEFARYVNR
jgi:hypothetical protein